METTKSTTETTEILAAFNYMLLKLAFRFVDNNRKELFSDSDFLKIPISLKLLRFNTKNDFTLKKISLFPFLVSVANGRESKEAMLGFFNLRAEQFVAGKEGISHKEIDKYLLALNNNQKAPALFRFHSYLTDRDNPEKKVVGFTTPLYHFLLQPNNENEDKIRSFVIDYFSDNLNFENQSTYTKIDKPKSKDKLENIFSRIDYCVDFLHDRRFELFANSSFEFLSAMSKNNSSYRMYRNLIDRHGDTSFFKSIFISTIEAEYFTVT